MPVTPDKPHSPLTLMEIGAIAAIVVIWGANNAAAKVATEVMPPLLVATLRFAIAAICLIPFVRPPFPNWKSLLLIVILGGPLHYGLLYWGFSLAQDVSPVSVASQLWIPFTTLFAFLLLGERLSIHALIGMIISLLGVVWMSADPHAFNDWKAILLITVVIAQKAEAAPTRTMAGQSWKACGSADIQTTPAKAIARPASACIDSRSPSSRKANRAVNGIQS